ncbi:MAG: aminotransferase class V-fold PLP-dependent enzyme, partial [Planctomycetes bacterium]|nr:aminotransferase class V-fold PLP-dependent enzyme [Planctomycetota bacterium]
QETRNISVTVVEPRDNGMIDPVDVRASLRFNTRLVVINHASNVTGLIQPIADIGVVARQRGVLMIVDAAQSAGHVPIDFSQLPIDLLACPGHKGLLGPLGTGIVALRPGLEKVLDCYRFGGTGSFSEDDRQPEGLPDRYESGNMNVPGIVGLNSGLGFLFKETIPTLRSREIELTQRLIQGLQSCPSVTVYGHPVHGKRTDEDNWVGVVSFNFESIEPQEGASILDESFEIQSRAGLHCAPGVHRWLGTIDRGGTIRFSIGHFTTSDEIDRAIEAVRQIATA